MSSIHRDDRTQIVGPEDYGTRVSSQSRYLLHTTCENRCTGLERPDVYETNTYSFQSGGEGVYRVSDLVLYNHLVPGVNGV